MEIKDRICAIMLPGKSITRLEEKIHDLEEYNLCWCSMTSFPMMEKFILNKINKKLDVVFECNEVKNWQDYNLQIRIPRMDEYLKRKNNYLITSSEVLSKLNKLNREELYYIYKNKIYVVQDCRKVDVPNGLALFIELLTKFGAKRIILFGCDGYKGKEGEDIDTYYRPEIRAIERKIGFGTEKASHLHSDTADFEGTFYPKYNKYCEERKIKPIEIINCSPISVINIFKKVNYEQIEEYCK